MKAPVDRELQIEIMKNAKQRSDERLEKWKKDAVVRDMISRPSPKQASLTVTTGVRLRKCA
ncbi:hypothetical protein [Paracoccus indicus]|uniref:hypothetical protein n=1 Tax=Paracoccus indicus TaxID=2079229 RepID=UPI0013B3AD05|nr:hypothetical protein [Paracoccus indicus]